MLDSRTQGKVHHAPADLIEVVGKTSLVYAAGLRAMKTRLPEDLKQFDRHLDRLNEADQICIALHRKAMRSARPRV